MGTDTLQFALNRVLGRYESHPIYSLFYTIERDKVLGKNQYVLKTLHYVHTMLGFRPIVTRVAFRPVTRIRWNFESKLLGKAPS